MTAEAFDQALNQVMFERLCRHEAAHATAALLLGLDVHQVAAEPVDLSSEPADPDEAAGYALIPAPDPADPEAVRRSALAVLVGPLEDNDAYWPPKWPLSLAPISSDESLLGRYVGILDLDQKGYAELVRDAYRLFASRAYDRLHKPVSHLLEERRVLDAETLRYLKSIAQGNAVEHLTVKAAATTTDLGQFTALAAVFGNIDRDGDRIVKGAFADSISAWQTTGRKVPLHWNHSADPDDIIGTVTPGAMIETDEGLVVEGQLDLEGSERARTVWQVMKTGSVGLSFGYLVTKSRRAADGANELVALDLFEISLTPAPANADTRVLGMKSAARDADAVRAKAHMLAVDLLLGVSDELFLKTGKRDDKALDHNSMEPVRIASFEC